MAPWIMLAAAVFVVSLIVWAVRDAARNDPCFWSHDKRFVSIRDLARCGHTVDWTQSGSHLQDARWLCTRCPSMGEDCIDKQGVWMIHQGALVPDEKRWASWKDRIRG